jgi:hypothetical protein
VEPACQLLSRHAPCADWLLGAALSIMRRHKIAAPTATVQSPDRFCPNAVAVPQSEAAAPSPSSSQCRHAVRASPCPKLPQPSSPCRTPQSRRCCRHRHPRSPPAPFPLRLTSSPCFPTGHRLAGVPPKRPSHRSSRSPPPHRVSHHDAIVIALAERRCSLRCRLPRRGHAPAGQRRPSMAMG